MANSVLLQEGHPLDSYLRPLKIGGASSSLELSQHENGSGARITGDLEVTGDISGNIKDMVLEDVTLDSLTTNSIISTDLTIDDAGTITLDSVDGITKFHLNGDTDDLCTLTVAANGATTLATADSDGAVGHLTLDADGNINIDAGSGEGGITFKTSGTTYAGISHHHSATWFDLYENGASGPDLLSIKVLANAEVEIATLDNAGALAHINIEADGHVEFDGCAVGFDLVAPTYNASDTDVDFTTGNKQFVLFGSGNITDLNLIFPDTTGNFVLLLKQDGTGSRTVTNYKAWDLVNSDAADGSATVKFAGGSNPTLTTDANHVDIISIFWDADNEIAYGVASLDFQF